MKKLYLLFGFALMGVLFFACQKDEPVVEQSALDTSEVVSVERTINYLPCFEQGNCPCIIMSVMPPSFAHRAYTCMSGLNPVGGSAISLMQDANGVYNSPQFLCNFPLGVCDEEGLPPPAIGHVLQFDNIGGFNYGDFYHFCMTPDNIAMVCNPYSFPIEMHLMCNPDAPNHQMVTFTLAGGQCKYFRITNHCHIEECD